MLSLRIRKRSKSGKEKETFYLGYVQFESLVTLPHGYEIVSVSLQIGTMDLEISGILMAF